MKLRWSGGEVTGAWDRPDGDPSLVLVLARGAGGDLDDRVLAGVAWALAARGVAVLRFNFPYREAGRRTPGSQKESEQSCRDVAEGARIDGIPLYCGGKSYGGRMATHIVADGFDADGLVLMSYPLHPPGRPEKIRDAHLPRIDVPMLFVQGTRDTFAQPDLLERTIKRLPRATCVSIEGGEHSLRVRGRGAAEVTEEIAQAIGTFVGV